MREQLLRFGRERPWTFALLSSNLAFWLLGFFGYSTLGAIFAGELGIAAPWRWVTYAWVTPYSTHPLLLIISLYVTGWIAGSLERTWGSRKFVAIFLVLSVLAATFHWVGSVATLGGLDTSVDVAGLHLPLISLFVIWAGLNPEATVLFMFVLPVKARYLALAGVVLTYFSVGPILGLFDVALPVAGWFWASKVDRGRPGPRAAGSPRQRVADWWQKRVREKKKSRFQVHEGKGQSGGRKDTGLTVVGSRREEVSKLTNEAEIELDRILDKIRLEGMASLTKEEKDRLDYHSRKLRGGS